MGGASFLGQIITWSTTIIVARILSPEDYGLIALAGLYTVFANYICMMGLSSAVVQVDDISDSQIRALYSFSLMMGVVMFVVGLLAAPLMVWGFDEPRLYGLIIFQNLIFLLGSPKSLQWSVLARETRFDIIAKIETGGRILASMCGLAMAFSGFGFWTLAAQAVLLELFQFIGFTYARPIKPAFSIPWADIKSLLSFGVKVLCRNCLLQLNASASIMIFGKLTTQTFLGAYQFSRQLTNMPFDKIIMLVNRVILPYLSKDKADKAVMREWSIKAADFQSLLLAPFYYVLFFSAEETINILLGDGWEMAVYPLKIFCIASVFKLIESYVGVALTALGHIGIQVKFVVVQIVLISGGLLWLTLWYGPEVALWVWLTVYPVMCIYYGHLLAKRIDLDFRSLLHCIWPTLAAHATLIVSLIVVSTWFEGAYYVTLGIKIGTGTLVYFASLYVFGPEKIRWLTKLYRRPVAKKV